MDSVCYIIVLALTLAIIVYGLWLMLKKKCHNETDSDVYQRWMRGFAFTMVGELVFIIGAAFCFGQGSGPDMVSKMFSRMKMGL